MADDFIPPPGPIPVGSSWHRSPRLGGAAVLAVGLLLAVVSLLALISGHPSH